MLPGQEWIISNRNGSYSSSTSSLANTRSYHGILVANMGPKFDRRVLVNKLYEIVGTDEGEISLDTNYYPGTVYPDGYRYQTGFSDFPIPLFLYKVGNIEIRKKIALHPYSDILSVRYDFPGKIPASFRIVPLLSFRSYHETIRSGRDTADTVEHADHLEFKWRGISVFLEKPGRFIMTGRWYYNFLYPVEEARGLPNVEDLFEPGELIMEPGRSVEISISAGRRLAMPFHLIRKAAEDFVRSQAKYLNSTGQISPKSSIFLTGDNIIAGYHWFGPWARDAFISLPGLLLTTGKFSMAQYLLMSYRNASRNGLIPKRLETPDDFATADSGLLYIYACWKLVQYSRNMNFAEKIYPFLLDILQTYFTGNQYYRLEGPFIRTLDAPLTWMDGKYNGKTYTPRVGLPVEINALWYNALRSADDIARKLKIKVPDYVEETAQLLSERFSSKFTDNGKFLDVADPDDDRIRPNFLFAYSLPFPIMSDFLRYKDIVDRKLLTQYGLRTLDPADPGYFPRYGGNQEMRDSAYHNGTVWPWLIGPYVTACSRSGISASQVFEFFRPLLRMPYLPEVLDGEPDGTPKGCMAQAWSYGEIMRVYHENVVNAGGVFS